jgi:hypothetical protein
MFPTELDSPPVKPNVIQATLLFDLPTLPQKETNAVIEEEKPLPAEPEEVIPLVETLDESQVNPVAEPEVPPLKIPTPELNQNVDLPEETEENNKVDETPPTDKNNTASASLNVNAPATSLAKRHLKSFQKQQQYNMAEQASRTYQKHKNSPELDTELQDPFVTEDEKFIDSLKVRADCSSTSKQTAAALLGFLGGQIDCSTPPPINSFIQDRINKKSLLPGQGQPKPKKRPQSIVIKK